MRFVFIWEQTATSTTYSINWLVFLTKMKSVYSAVRTGSLNKAVCPSCLERCWPRYAATVLTSSYICMCTKLCKACFEWLWVQKSRSLREVTSLGLLSAQSQRHVILLSVLNASRKSWRDYWEFVLAFSSKITIKVFAQRYLPQQASV
jgi:hypothetical protein